jgi:hypothetical protein
MSSSEPNSSSTTNGNIFRDPNLQIIPDDLFARVQLKLKTPPRGRKGKKAESAIPRILNGRVHCPAHKIPLQCTGMSGGVMQCKECQSLRAEDRGAFTLLPRRHGTEVLLHGIATAILHAEPLIPEVIAACQAAAESAQTFDPSRRLKLEEEIAELDDSIKTTYRHPGKTPERIAKVDRDREEFENEYAKRCVELAAVKKLESAPPADSQGKRASPQAR